MAVRILSECERLECDGKLLGEAGWWRHSVVSGHTHPHPRRHARHSLIEPTLSRCGQSTIPQAMPSTECPSFFLFHFRDSTLSDSFPRPHSNQSPFSTAPTNLTYLGLQIRPDVPAFLGFTSQNFRTTKERPHGVDPTYLDRFCARRCPGNAQEK